MFTFISFHGGNGGAGGGGGGGPTSPPLGSGTYYTGAGQNSNQGNAGSGTLNSGQSTVLVHRGE